MQVIVVVVRRALTKPLHASTMQCKTFALAAFVRFPPSICLDNSGKILRVVLSQLDKRAVSEGVGKPHENYLFECVIATFNDR